MIDRYFLDTNVFIYSFYDSLIIAAALEARCQVLYSEDMQDGQAVRGLKIANPFAERPAR